MSLHTEKRNQPPKRSVCAPLNNNNAQCASAWCTTKCGRTKKSTYHASTSVLNHCCYTIFYARPEEATAVWLLSVVGTISNAWVLDGMVSSEIERVFGVGVDAPSGCAKKIYQYACRNVTDSSVQL
jgi:hypothetical protein